jgi:hypothetical protein
MKKRTDELIELIKSCNPDRWSTAYTLHGVEVSPDFTKLEVTNYGLVHETIEDLMTQLRQIPQ